MKLERVAIVSKVGSAEAERAAAGLAGEFPGKVYTVEPVSVHGAESVGTLGELRGENLDLVVTLGGDGTTLRAFRELDDETPLLTVNVGGNRGILAEITPEQVGSAIRQMASGEVILEKRTRVSAVHKKERYPPALNEIYICRRNMTRTAEMEIRFQNDTVRQKMDGVIVATPSGSTGHSFSLGGPVLHESLDVLIITPVAPVYRLASMVVPDEEIQLSCSHDYNIVMDAQVVKEAGYEEPVTVKKHPRHAVFVRLKRRGLRQMSRLGF